MGYPVIFLILFLFIGITLVLFLRKKPPREAKKSFKAALFKTNSAWHPFKKFFNKKVLSQKDLESLEELLITSDVGVKTSQKILEKLKNKLSYNDDVKENLKKTLEEIMAQVDHSFSVLKEPCVFLIVGVNGVGKTTTIAKLTQCLLNLQRKPFLVAGDTFRAAAIEQLENWAQRLKVPLFKQNMGAQSASVIFDGISSGLKKQYDTIVCDTAGRLQSKEGLMLELEKVKNAAHKASNSCEVRTLLVLDATLGQNALKQVEEFGKVVPISGIIMTKLDGSAKGGILLPIVDQYHLPIYFIGTGESINDFSPFDPKVYVSFLLH